MKFVGLLTSEEVKALVDCFYDLENSRTTRVIIVPDLESQRTLYRVSLESEPIVSDLLEASFKDGMMNHWQWSEKFRKVD